MEGDETFRTVRVAGEESAVNLLSGNWLGGDRGALIYQSSGLANTFNALESASVPWGLPFVGVVSRRGGIGEHNRAQIAGGYNMDAMLDEIGVRNQPSRQATTPSEPLSAPRRQRLRRSRRSLCCSTSPTRGASEMSAH